MPATVAPKGAAARIGWIDAAKGLGIALIVVGHVFSTREPSLFYQYLYAFHVPLFFFLAGLTLRIEHGHLVSLVRKKLRSLMLPYVIYALLGYLFYLAGFALTSAMGRELEQFRYGLWAPLWGILWGTVGSGNLVNSPVWFLPALFWATLIVHEVNARIDSMPTRLGVIGLLALLGSLLAGRVTLPMSLVPALLALPFLQAGLMHAHWLGRIPASGAKAWLLTAAIGAVFVASPLNGFAMQSEAVIGNPLLFFSFAFAGITLTTRLLQSPLPGVSSLVRMGQHSLAIMVIHMLVIKSVQVVLAGGLGVSFSVLTDDARWGMMVLCLVAAALVPAVWVLENWLPATLGKQPVQRHHD